MKRRTAIRNILLASAGTLFLPACTEANVIDFLGEGRLTLNNRHKDYLQKISETFLPLADLAKKVGSPVDYMLVMLNDCHSPEEVTSFAQGFDQYKLLMEQSQTKIKDADPTKALAAVATTLEAETPQEDLVFFINTTKKLSIRHLMSSEYYMTEYREYQLVPGRFDGCIDA